MTGHQLYLAQIRLSEAHDLARDMLCSAGAGVRETEAVFNEKAVLEAKTALSGLMAVAADVAQALTLWRQERVVRPGESGKTRQAPLGK